MSDPNRPPRGRHARRPPEDEHQPPPPPPFVPNPAPQPPDPQYPPPGATGPPNPPTGWQQQPTGGYQPPSGWRQQPTGGHARQPEWPQQPSGGYQPPGWQQQPSGGYQAPSGWRQQPTGGHEQPSGWRQQPTGGYQPPSNRPQATGGYGQPPGGEPGVYGEARGGHAWQAQPSPQPPLGGAYAPGAPVQGQRPQFQAPAAFPPHGGRQAPGGRPDGRDGEADGESSQARRTWLGARARRVVEVCALAVLLPGLLGLYWVDETGRAESLEPPVKVSSVAHGKIGELAGARWTVYKRESTPQPGNAGGRDAVRLQVVLAVKARDAKSAKTIGGYGMEYRFVDAQGREWTADAVKPGTVTPGRAFPLTVRGTVPRARAESLALVVRPPKTERRGGDPLPSLRFEP